MPTRENVADAYDRIADHFAETRPRAWPEVASFLEGREATVAADLGVGNARHAVLLADRAETVVGLDASREMLGVARERAGDAATDLSLLEADAASLPFATDAVDLAVYVATLHHLPTPALRRRSLADLDRVLAPGGEALVGVWSTAHDRFADRRTDDPGGDEDAPAMGFDAEIDWTLPGGETVPRYYHVYAPPEFEAVLAESPLAVRSVTVSSGNCYAVVASGDGVRDT